jgi:hypothetical protein
MPLTPEEFSKLALKSDVDKIMEILENMDRKFEDRFDNVMTALDGIVSSINDIKVEQAANLGAHERFEERFVLLEDKIENLNKKN